MLWDDEEVERAKREYVHHYLADYSRKFYTLDYQEVTTEWLSEILDDFAPAPLGDPTNPFLFTDPLSIFFKKHGIGSLPPYDEAPHTTKEAIQLIKDTQSQCIVPPSARANMRSERALRVDSCPPLEKVELPFHYMLTSKARRHTRSIGSTKRKEKILSNTFNSFKAVSHLPPPLPDIDVPEPRLSSDEILKVTWAPPQGTDRTALRSILEPIAKLQSVNPSNPAFNDVSYIKRFDNLLDDTLEVPDIPQMRWMPLFPRSRQPGYREPQGEETKGQGGAGVDGWKDVKEIIAEDTGKASSPDIPAESMRLVDGWQVVDTSSPAPSTPCTSEDEDMVDQLLEFPSTPPTDDIPLAEEIQKKKLEVPLFPRSRRVRGRAGVKPNILKDHTMKTFLPTLLPSPVKPIPPQPRKEIDTPVDSTALPPSSPTMTVLATSLLGEAPASLLAAEALLLPAPDPEAAVDVEIEALYCPGGSRAPNPLDVIMEEGIEENKNMVFMEVPSLPEPTVHTEPGWIPKDVKDLTTPAAAGESDSTTEYGYGLVKREVVTKAPMKKSISLSLSWAAFTSTEQLPTLDQVLDIETPLPRREAGLHASTMQTIQALFKSCGIADDDGPATVSSKRSGRSKGISKKGKGGDSAPEKVVFAGEAAARNERERQGVYMRILDGELEVPGGKDVLSGGKSMFLLGRLERMRLARGKRKSNPTDNDDDGHEDEGEPPLQAETEPMEGPSDGMVLEQEEQQPDTGVAGSPVAEARVGPAPAKRSRIDSGHFSTLQQAPDDDLDPPGAPFSFPPIPSTYLSLSQALPSISLAHDAHYLDEDDLGGGFPLGDGVSYDEAAPFSEEDKENWNPIPAFRSDELGGQEGFIYEPRALAFHPDFGQDYEDEIDQVMDDDDVEVDQLIDDEDGDVIGYGPGFSGYQEVEVDELDADERADIGGGLVNFDARQVNGLGGDEFEVVDVETQPQVCRGSYIEDTADGDEDGMALLNAHEADDRDGQTAPCDVQETAPPRKSPDLIARQPTLGSSVQNVDMVEGLSIPPPRPNLTTLSSVMGRFTNTVGLFARMRSVHLPETIEKEPEPTAPTLDDTPPPTDDVSQPQTVPPELVDSNTLTLPDPRPQPSTRHKYLASLNTIQRRALVKALQSPQNLVTLIERSTIDHHLLTIVPAPTAATGATVKMSQDSDTLIVLDTLSCVLLVPLLTLPARAGATLTLLSALSWSYAHIYVIFEAYPVSCSFRSTERKSDLHAYTPPLVKATKKLRRDVGIAAGLGQMNASASLKWAFADTVSDAAAFVRLCGDIAEARDRAGVEDGASGGLVWDHDRAWLDDGGDCEAVDGGTGDGETDDERDVLAVAGLNPFSAALIMAQVGLEEFLGMEGEERVRRFAGCVGLGAMTAVNEDLAARYRSLSDAASSNDDERPYYEETADGFYQGPV